MKKQLSSFKMFQLALGQMGFTFLLGTLSLYTLRFYAPTEGTGLPLLLPIGAIGIIQGLSIAFDALIDPWIASVSDNSKNPNGRRVPFMRKAAIPAGIFCVLVFISPINAQSWVNVIWVLVMLLLYCMCRSFYDINIRALLPEVVTDAFRRTRYFTIVAVMNTVGSLLLSMVPAFIAALEGNASGLAAWRISLMVFPVIGTVLMLLGAFAICENDYVDESSQQNEEKVPLFKSLQAVFRNREIIVYLLGTTTFAFSAGVFSVGFLFVLELLLGLQDTMAPAVFAVLTIGTLLVYPPLLKLQKRIGKRKIMLICTVFAAAMFLLGFLHEPVSNLLGTGTIAVDSMWVGFAGEGAKIGSIALALIMGLLFAYPQAASGAVGASVFADLAQYEDMVTGQNRKGMVMAVVSLINVLPVTLVPAVVGLVIYIGSINDMPTAQGVRVAMIIAVLCAAASFVAFFFYNERKVFDVILEKEEPEKISIEE